jgi:hypothetical protein
LSLSASFFPLVRVFCATDENYGAIKLLVAHENVGLIALQGKMDHPQYFTWHYVVIEYRFTVIDRERVKEKAKSA